MREKQALGGDAPGEERTAARIVPDGLLTHDGVLGEGLTWTELCDMMDVIEGRTLMMLYGPISESFYAAREVPPLMSPATQVPLIGVSDWKFGNVHLR